MADQRFRMGRPEGKSKASLVSTFRLDLIATFSTVSVSRFGLGTTDSTGSALRLGLRTTALAVEALRLGLRPLGRVVRLVGFCAIVKPGYFTVSFFEPADRPCNVTSAS